MAVVATFAIGVGATTAVFTTIDRFLLQEPPGVVDPKTIDRIQQRFIVPMTRDQRTRVRFSYSELRALASELDQTRTAGFTSRTVTGGAGNRRRELRATYVAEDYFGVLGVKPQRGRFFDPGEYGRQATAVAVISDALWTQDFARDPSAIGRFIAIGTQRFSIIGVASRGFSGIEPEAADLWVPFNAIDDGLSKDDKFGNPFDLRLNLVIRRAAGSNRVALRDAVSRSLRANGPLQGAALLVPVTRILDPMRDANGISISLRLIAAAIAILALVCANVGNLLIARSLVRQREIGIRLALGASRGRIARQLLIEVLLLAVIAGTLSTVMGACAGGLLQHTLVPSVGWRDIHIWRSGGVALAVAVIAGLSTSLVSVLRLDEQRVGDALKFAGREGSPKSSRMRGMMLVIQTGLSVVLLTGAALLLRSLAHVRDVWVPPGSNEVVVAFVPVGPSETMGEVEESALTAAASRVAGVPDVQNVALSANVPTLGVTLRDVFLPGRDSIPTVPGHSPTVEVVSPGFLSVMGLSVIAGRDFATTDRRGSGLVTLVSDYMANQFWPGESPLGKCLVIERRNAPCRTVVGVVQDVHAMKLAEPPTFRYYLPLDQFESWKPRAILVRARAGRRDAVRGRLRDIVGALSNAEWMIRDYSDILDPELRPWRVNAMLFAALAVVALFVASIGTFSNVLYSVTRRTHDIGIRRSLGAGAVAIIESVLSETALPILVGAIAGAIAAVGASWLLNSLLYGVSPVDAAALALAVGSLIAAAAAASFLPLRTALRVDPIVVLAAE